VRITVSVSILFIIERLRRANAIPYPFSQNFARGSEMWSGRRLCVRDKPEVGMQF